MRCVMLLSLVAHIACYKQARADTIVTGIGGGLNVFIQEYWEAGSPRYAIANLSNEVVQISVHEWTRLDHPGKQLGGPWEVKPHCVSQVDASPLKGKGSLDFWLGGNTLLGSVTAPSAPREFTKKGVVTTTNLNASGGAFVHCKADTLTFKSETVIKLELSIASGAGRIRFKRVWEEVDASGLFPPVNPQHRERMAEAYIIEAACDTLAVTMNDKEIDVDARDPHKTPKTHRVILGFKVPKVGRRTMVEVRGYMSGPPGGGPHGSGWFGRGVIVEPSEVPYRFSEGEIDNLWNELGSQFAAAAYQASWLLVAAPEQTAPFLKERVRPAVVDSRRITQLLDDLDNDRFASREKAKAELMALGELAESALRKALEGQPPPEVQRAVNEILKRLQEQPESADRRRQLRAIEVLEHIGTPEAKEVLDKLAKGAPGARITEEARASLQRLAKRQAPSK